MSLSKGGFKKREPQKLIFSNHAYVITKVAVGGGGACRNSSRFPTSSLGLRWAVVLLATIACHDCLPRLLATIS
jgi:hypothetical protein